MPITLIDTKRKLEAGEIEVVQLSEVNILRRSGGFRKLNKKELRELFMVLQQAEAVKYFGFANSSLSGYMGDLLRLLQSRSDLISIDLRGNGFSFLQLQKIVDTLRSQPRLVELRINGNDDLSEAEERALQNQIATLIAYNKRSEAECTATPGCTIFHYAAAKGDVDTLWSLLSQNPEQRDVKCGRGGTALDYAVSSQHIPATLLLQEIKKHEFITPAQTPIEQRTIFADLRECLPQFAWIIKAPTRTTRRWTIRSVVNEVQYRSLKILVTQNILQLNRKKLRDGRSEIFVEGYNSEKLEEAVKPLAQLVGAQKLQQVLGRRDVGGGGGGAGAGDVDEIRDGVGALQVKVEDITGLLYTVLRQVQVGDHSSALYADDSDDEWGDGEMDDSDEPRVSPR